MNKILLAVAVATSATSASAGALTDPIVEPIVIIEDTSSSINQSWLVPAFFLIMLAAGMSRPGYVPG